MLFRYCLLNTRPIEYYIFGYQKTFLQQISLFSKRGNLIEGSFLSTRGSCLKNTSDLKYDLF